MSVARTDVLKALTESDFLDDALENWVDPDCPLSACLIGLWLRHFIELPESCHNALDEVVRLPERDAVSYLLRLITAQRLEALATQIGGVAARAPYFRPEVAHLLLRMIAEVSYHKGRLPSQLRIAEQLKGQQRSEVRLYTLDGYRDHLYHAIHVASLGILLSDARLLDQGDRPLLEGEILGDWLLAALCHDLGYGMKPELDVGSGAGALSNLSQYADMDEAVREKRREYLADVNRRALEDIGCQRDLGDQFDHGIISYDYVKNLVDSLPANELSEEEKKRFRSALSAIAKHNLHAEPVSFAKEKEPIAALLVLCDELQDWGRPKWDSEAFASKVLALLHFGQDRPYEPSIICRRIRISAARSTGTVCRRTIILEYADPMQEQYDPWALIVCKLAALQRLSEMPPLRLILKLPRSRDWESLILAEELYSYRAVMRRFTVQFDHPVLREEVLWAELPGKPSVRWVRGDDDVDIIADLQGVEIDHEAVIVDLEGISQFRPVLGSVDSFFSEFEQFMRRLFASQGRTFLGSRRG